MFNDADFARMEFPIHGVEDIDTVKRLDRVGELEPIRGHNRERIIRYLVYMYDYGSPYQSIRDVIQRKRACALHVGFDFNKDENLLNKLRLLEDPFSVAVVGLLREQNNALYTSIVVQEQLFYHYIERLIRPMKNDLDDKDELDAMMKQKKLSEAMNENRIAIQKLYHEMSGNDAILEAALPKAIQITKAESMARIIKHRK